MYYATVAFCTALLFLGALRRSAYVFGLIDRPSPRKTHVGDVPVVGGLAIGAALVTTCFIQGSPSIPFVTAGIIVLATGLMDDLREFSAHNKFAGQLAAALIMTYWADLQLANLGNLWGTGDVMPGNWAILFTLFCVVGLMNAMNMIDGIDGLAGGIGLVASGWLCLAGGLGQHEAGASIVCLLGATLAAFLIFNLRHPWRRHAVVFLGDAGSMFLGLVLVWFAVSTSQSSSHDFYAISAVWMLGVPIMDTVYVMLRRMVRGMNPFSPDRRHVHHTLIYIGLSESRTAWLLLCISLAFGGIGFAGSYYHVPEYVLTYGFIGLFAVYCAFMQYWRVILPLLGVKPKRFALRPRPVMSGTK